MTRSVRSARSGTRWRRRWVRWAAALAALALVAGACGNTDDEAADDDGAETTEDAGGTETTGGEGGDERDTFVEVDAPGVDDTEIRFASVATGSEANPLGTNIQGAFNDGIEAYFAWRNSEGGVYGRDLVLSSKRDDSLALNDQEIQAAISQDDVFGLFVATLNFAGADTAQEAGIPTFGWNIHPQFSDRPAIFGHLAPLCFGCTGFRVPFLAQQEEAANVAILGYGVSESSKLCAEGNRESFEQYGDDVGAEVVFYDDSLPFGLTSGVAPQVSEMKKQGVDFVTTCMDLNGMKVLAEEMRKQGLDATLHHTNTYDHAFVADNADLFEGDIDLPTFLAFETDVQPEMLEQFIAWTDETGVDRQELTMIGWIAADIAFTGLLEAGPEFGRQAVVDGLNTLTDYSAGGLVVPIDWTHGHEDPTGEEPRPGSLECFNAVRIVDGEFVPAEWQEPGAPWTCWDNTQEEWSPPEQRSFE